MTHALTVSGRTENVVADNSSEHHAVDVSLTRRHIGKQMRGLREAKGLSMEAAGKLIEKSRAWILRMEAGGDNAKLRQLEFEHLLRHYGAEKTIADNILEMVIDTNRAGKTNNWWHDFTETQVPGFFSLYVSLEDSAATIKQFEFSLVPGLLQTQAYADAVHRVPAGLLTEEEITGRVKTRLGRQGLLSRSLAPRLEVILDETVFLRAVGGPGVMGEQLRRLIKVSEWGNISIRLLPLSAGLHAGMAASTPFTILEFPKVPSGEPLEPPLAFVNSLTGALYLQKPAEITAFRQTWQDMEDRALSEEETREVIRTKSEGL